MKIKRFICGSLESNCYVIYHKSGGYCYIIDAGGAREKVLNFIKSLCLVPKAVLSTHHHYDHTDEAEYFANAFKCPHYMHRADTYMYKGASPIALEDRDIILLGVEEEVIKGHVSTVAPETEEILVVNTPGHTHGSCCFISYKSKVAFTGDTLFDVDIGRTDLKDGDDFVMADSLRKLDSLLQNDITIYPGHDGDVTMKYVRNANSYFNEYIRRK